MTEHLPLILATFLLAGMVKGVVGLGLPTIAVGLLGLAMKELPLGTAYAIWTGVGAVGTVIAGTTITSTTQVVTVQAPNLSTDPTTSGLPDIPMTLPRDFSGNIDGITITLKVQDIDSDGPGNGEELSDTVTLNLVVTPVAGDVAVGAVTTAEDTAVALLQDVRVTDTGTGTEVIDSVAFDVPAGWTLTAIPTVASRTPPPCRWQSPPASPTA